MIGAFDLNYERSSNENEKGRSKSNFCGGFFNDDVQTKHKVSLAIWTNGPEVNKTFGYIVFKM